MSASGNPPPPPPPPPPNGHPQLPGQYAVDVDPEAAGLVRKERLGWGLVFAVLGAVLVVAALFVDWVETGIVVSYERGADGPLENTAATAGIFSAIDTIKDVTGPDPEAHDPGTFARLFFPWLALLVALAAITLAVGATVGLRTKARTGLARVLGTVLAVVAAVAAVAAIVLLGIDVSDDGTAVTATPAPAGGQPPSGEPRISFLASFVDPYLGVGLWLLGAALLAIGAMIGPRVVHDVPPGGLPSGAAGAAPAGPPTAAWAPRLVRHTTQVGAVVVGSIGAALAIAGYTFLPWGSGGGDSVLFADISEVARDTGFGDNELTEAYFAWLGWIALVLLVAVAVVLALGRKPRGISPKVARPVLSVLMIVVTAVHWLVVLDASSDLGDFDIGAHAVGLGLVLATIGVLVPLRARTRVLIGGPPAA